MRICATNISSSRIVWISRTARWVSRRRISLPLTCADIWRAKGSGEGLRKRSKSLNKHRPRHHDRSRDRDDYPSTKRDTGIGMSFIEKCYVAYSYFVTYSLTPLEKSKKTVILMFLWMSKVHIDDILWTTKWRAWTKILPPSLSGTLVL